MSVQKMITPEAGKQVLISDSLKASRARLKDSELCLLIIRIQELPLSVEIVLRNTHKMALMSRSACEAVCEVHTPTFTE